MITIDKNETDRDIENLIQIFPSDIADALQAADRFDALLEVILDLGRPSEARYPNGEMQLTQREITQDEIDEVVSRVGAFGEDNRAGIERTLHRISAIRNRRGKVIGLTCRVGRAIYGTVDIIRDIVESGQSILLLGRPGVGKTTMLREVARILAEKNRVVIVDTSNEIGGDGDIPHPAVGRARRMQVRIPSEQHNVMIEAVENHMPQVIVIDEIGTELEAAAARTIAERGVQLVGTAHGNTLDNLMMNPTLSDLIGGIQTVTLSDDEARRRGTQKSVLERKAPPTFDVVVEIQDWDRVVMRRDVAAAVDAILRGRPIGAELRVKAPSGEIQTSNEEPHDRSPREKKPKRDEEAPQPPARKRGTTLRVYPYGLNQNRLRQASRQLGVPVALVDKLSEADVLFTLRTYYRKRPKVIQQAEQRDIPVYVLRNNTVTQIEIYLEDIFGLDKQQPDDRLQSALSEARDGIQQIISGERKSVRLAAQDSFTRRLQHQMAREANLLSRSSGSEPHRSVTIHSS